MTQGLLFNPDETLSNCAQIVELAFKRRCGKCTHMDESLPGCGYGLGRCVNKASRNYYLKPEHTRINACYPEGDPDRDPPDGSWAYVARDSAGCEAFERR